MGNVSAMIQPQLGLITTYCTSLWYQPPTFKRYKIPLLFSLTQEGRRNESQEFTKLHNLSLEMNKHLREAKFMIKVSSACCVCVCVFCYKGTTIKEVWK